MKLEDPLIEESDLILPTKIWFENGWTIWEAVKDLKELDDAKYDCAIQYSECLQALALKE